MDIEQLEDDVNNSIVNDDVPSKVKEKETKYIKFLENQTMKT